MSKIIIVEDDPMIAEIYEKKFQEAGYEVLLADTGEQVLSLAKKEAVDLILLDLILPRMSGFDVIKTLKDPSSACNSKIIVFSNLNQSEDREKAMKLGADGFIVKAEYAPSDLVKEISRLLNQYSEETKNEENGQLISSANGRTSAKKILMMEDEEVFKEMFGEKLVQDGFDVHFAENGALGLKEALRNDYDLFIIDMVMPAMTGDEIVSRLKLEDRTKNVPVVIMSASVDEVVQNQMLEMGIEEFFVKTQLIPSDLSKKIGEILNK